MKDARGKKRGKREDETGEKIFDFNIICVAR